MGFFTSSKSFTPKTDIPDLSGKVILVTGGNNGIGYQTTLLLSSHKPKQIFLCARSEEKFRAAQKEIEKTVPDPPITYLELDLTSFESIRAAARNFLTQSDRLDLLYLNAGVMGLEPSITKDGYEVQFGTNHMGHALLTKLFMPILLKTAAEPNSDVRVIAVSSTLHASSVDGGIDFEGLKTPMESASAYKKYGQSKLANILFANGLHRHFGDKGITAVSLHPGLVSTNILGSYSGHNRLVGMANRFVAPLVAKSPENGAKNQLWAAFAKKGAQGVQSGEYYEPIGVAGKKNASARDEKLTQKLWEWTEKELEGKE
ncbi:short-chain dehydrogenase/reductase [Phlyctema vagabunda]|uniref:Short-chain dehydrogenase/reductase n=1 Tax=Phlyctema vagabunda TaxID=108571 RepID=A0ABR4P8R7_9HELO